MVKHSFGDDPSSMYWNDERDLAVFVYSCERTHTDPEMSDVPGMSMEDMSEGCSIEKEVLFEIGSVKDDDGAYDGPYGYEMRENSSAIGDVVHKSEFDEVPEWVFNSIESLKTKVEEATVDDLMFSPRGLSVNIRIVVNDNRHSVHLHKVEEELLD